MKTAKSLRMNVFQIFTTASGNQEVFRFSHFEVSGTALINFKRKCKNNSIERKTPLQNRLITEVLNFNTVKGLQNLESAANIPIFQGRGE